MSRKIVVLGATSKIAQEVARLWAAEGKQLLLVARHDDRLAAVGGDLCARGAAAVDCVTADLADVSTHAVLATQVAAVMPDFDTILLAYGTLGDQERAEADPEYALAELNTNFNSAVSLLMRLTPALEQRRAGCVAVISSVAGDRGRRSNYVYGSAKGALTLYLQGLRAKLFPAGVRVLTIKPGPVATPMTAHLPQTGMFAQPEAVAKAIHREIERGSREVLYVPWQWRWIMTVIRHIPESIGKKMKF
jgi:decaprenylphospho-beta-D-erythro-pentofuranosid-2-ulose 2-reductase